MMKVERWVRQNENNNRHIYRGGSEETTYPSHTMFTMNNEELDETVMS